MTNITKLNASIKTGLFVLAKLRMTQYIIFIPTRYGIETMTKQEALEVMNEATNEMARTSNYPELYAAAKAKHTAAKKALVEMMSEKEEQEVIEEVESAKQELEAIVNEIEDRNNELVKNAGVNANSVIAGIANGSISTQTEWEATRVYELKKIIMSGGGFMANQARQRNIARVKARNARRL